MITASSGIATRARRVTPSPKAIASTATSALAAASTPSVCTTPIHGTNTTPASTDPAMPPSVLSASTAPSPAPTRAGSTESRTAYRETPRPAARWARRRCTAPPRQSARWRRQAGYRCLPASARRRPIAGPAAIPRATREFDQRHQPRPDHQQREGAPRVARAVHAPRHQRAAERQPGQIGGQHHREGKGPGAQELDDGLRPDHFIAQGDTARHRIERQRQPALRGDLAWRDGWRRESAATSGTRRLCQSAPAPASRFSPAAAQALPNTPSSGMATNAASSVPAIAPAVLVA